MQYYEPATETQYTAFQLTSRGLLHDDIDLATLDIYPLTEEQPQYNAKNQQLTNERVEGDTENGFQLMWDVEYLSLEQVKLAKQSEITTAHDAFLKERSAEYSDMERQTWDMQRVEAEALIADAKASARLVRAIAATRGMDVLELAKRIDANAKNWTAIAGNVTGQRLALQDRVTAAKTPEEVVAIKVVFAVPEAVEAAEKTEAS
ncbi:hypothetical protein [Halodesulfovibrio spirochaetisodalis]|uniref:hypothetical protein n=1 Tax=Halodesulfovibrio spirochaetisodalis TaxID=1560234 RepID=UPI0008321A01|nr:hypothetical protein [Halodesulfovibrio spirochaetisodalis]